MGATAYWKDKEDTEVGEMAWRKDKEDTDMRAFTWMEDNVDTEDESNGMEGRLRRHREGSDSMEGR